MSAPANQLAPDTTGTQQQLTTTVNANAVITAYSHALQYVVIQQLPNQGSWFDTFNANLKLAQQHAQVWVETLGPEVFATIPQAIINYGNTFTAATQDILGILQQIQGVPTQQQQDDINNLINAVLVELQAQQTTLSDVYQQLQTFMQTVQADHTALATGQNSAQAQVQIDETQLAKIQAKINSIQQQIQSDSQKALMSEIGLGVAIFVTVAAIALTVATGGIAAPIAIGVGVLGIGAAIAGTVIFNQDVSQDFDDLYAQQKALSDEQAQVSGLIGITNAINSLVTANEAATQALSDVLDTWQVLEQKLKAVVTDLQNAEAPNIPAIIESLDIQTAQTAWNQLVTFATSMQTSAESITVQVANQPGQKVAA
ncbi:MAG TPA: HBL/NHE enterotoxin family protein [Thermomicrobiaceae bacterium]|nr:HBL/NHE enterotoxin family protein [Thermomicrobiaceae bacterium]